MSIFVKTTIAPKPRTKEAKQVSLFYAGVLVVFVVTQLFTFDTFIELVPAFNLPLGPMMTFAVAPLLVASELFAIPFLLRMQLSVAFRWLSMMLGLLVSVMWVGITAWIAVTQPAVSTVGFLGTLFDLVPGWWAVFIALALVILAAWSSWGLWPDKRNK